MTNSKNELQSIVREATPLLEAGLKDFSVGQDIPCELQLHAANCGLATAALQQWLRETYEIETDRYIVKADLEAQDITKSRRVSHVLLRTHAGLHIDPTYSQFHAHVGLTPRTAIAQDKVSVYPAEKIAVFSDSDAFAARYAEHVHNVDETGEVKPGVIEIGTDGAFRGASEDVMRHFYTRLWSPASSEPYPLEEQTQWFQATAKQIADTMKA